MPSKNYEPGAVGVQRWEMSFLVKEIKEGFMKEDASGLGLEG